MSFAQITIDSMPKPGSNAGISGSTTHVLNKHDPMTFLILLIKIS